MGLFKSSSKPRSQITLEKISEDPSWGIYRHKVPNGWLVVARTVESISVTFTPDPQHKWEIPTGD